MNILQALTDPKVFGAHFKRKQDSFAAWRTFLSALFALPMTAEQLKLYQQCTGRTTAPTTPASEAWLVIGRRGGKSFVLALIACFIAVFKDWRPYLAPGEIATVMIVAADRKQARVILRYVRGLLTTSLMLKRQVVNDVAERIELKNNVAIEIHTTSFKTTRGYTIVAALCDELAFWPTSEDSAAPDVEIINAIRPAMATIPNALLLCASSPHARKGALWEAHRKHFGKNDDPVLVWQAATRTMNPTVPQSYIDDHMQEDPARATAEYFAAFRSDVESFVNREVVALCTAVGTYERPPQLGVYYKAFLDPAGGSGTDSMTLAIGHNDRDGTVIVDALREVKPPFSPEFVVEEFAALLKTYGVFTVTGDRWGGEFAREPFRKLNIDYQLAEQPKTEMYAHCLLPMLNSARISLLDHSRAIQQIVGLERRTARGARDSIDHAPNAHDDLANVIAGLTSIVGTPGYDWNSGWLDADDKPKEDPEIVKQRRRKLYDLLMEGKPVPF